MLINETKCLLDFPEVNHSFKLTITLNTPNWHRVLLLQLVSEYKFNRTVNLHSILRKIFLFLLFYNAILEPAHFLSSSLFIRAKIWDFFFTCIFCYDIRHSMDLI